MLAVGGFRFCVSRVNSFLLRGVGYLSVCFFLSFSLCSICIQPMTDT